MNNPYSAYKATQTTTANQLQLIVMLHDGAIRFLSQAAIATSKKDYSEKSACINKVFAIIDHLWDSLDKDRGGEVATNLERIHKHMHDRLYVANVKDDISIMKEVMGHLRSLRDSWAQLETQGRNQRATTAIGGEGAGDRELQFTA